MKDDFTYFANPYFSENKLSCQATGRYYFSQDFLRRLIKIREEFARPIYIVSGFRDPKEHPIEKKKKNLKRVSPHPSGFAVDCRVRRDQYADLIRIALNNGCRVGVRCRSSGTNRLHLDGLTDREIHFWSYDN